MIPTKDSRVYIDVLQRMTPEQRLQKAFELSEFTRRLFRHGLRKRFPSATEEELQQLFLDRLAKCHNKNY